MKEGRGEKIREFETRKSAGRRKGIRNNKRITETRQTRKIKD